MVVSHSEQRGWRCLRYDLMGWTEPPSTINKATTSASISGGLTGFGSPCLWHSQSLGVKSGRKQAGTPRVPIFQHNNMADHRVKPSQIIQFGSLLRGPRWSRLYFHRVDIFHLPNLPNNLLAASKKFLRGGYHFRLLNHYEPHCHNASMVHGQLQEVWWIYLLPGWLQ